jgi:hypothetical protein
MPTPDAIQNAVKSQGVQLRLLDGTVKGNCFRFDNSVETLKKDQDYSVRLTGKDPSAA